MRRKYLDTHPWIKFELSLEGLDPSTWMLLGEAQSKCKHIARVLLEPQETQELQIIYLNKGVRGTAAIEGNTLTEEEVGLVISGDLNLPKSKEYLAREILNIIGAYNEILDEHVNAINVELSAERIKEYNKKILAGLKVENHVVPGEIRKTSVGVFNYRGAPAEDCAFLIEELCKMLSRFSMDEHWNIACGILKAIIAHLYIAWIHPFGDGNGRTARLVEFEFCIAAGVPATAAHLLSNFYNETRNDYYRALDETSKYKSPFPFIRYALQGYVDQLDAQIEKIREAQQKIFWENYIHKKFHGQETEAARRRRHLALDLSRVVLAPGKGGEWLDIAALSTLSTRLALDYVNKTKRTLARDIQSLEEMKLVKRDKNKIYPNLELLSAYLPKAGRA